jgi:hypothetical protein
MLHVVDEVAEGDTVEQDHGPSHPQSHTHRGGTFERKTRGRKQPREK